MQSQLSYERVRTGLEQLKMSAALDVLDNVLEAGRVEELAAVEIFDRLLDIEIQARHERRVETNLKFAGLPYRMRIEDFDFDGTPVNEALIRDLASGTFLADQRNAVLIGGTGTGKSHLAIAIARALIRNGSRAASSTSSIWSIASIPSTAPASRAVSPTT